MTKRTTPRGMARSIIHSRPVKALKQTLSQNRLALFGFVVLVIVLSMAIFAPTIAPYDPTAQNIQNQLEPPSPDHLMGTDQFGRDIFSRVIFGARLSVQVSVLAVGFAILVGVPFGLISGYYGGYVDEVIMRLMDIILSFPAVLMALTLIVVLGQGIQNLILAISIVYVPTFARVTRSEVLSVRELEYVKAAKAIGDSNPSILRKDVLPNVLAPVIVQATISLAFAILAEAALSFLGLGTPPPTPSWGRMLSNSRSFMRTAWWWAAFPGVAIMLTILAWNFIGDALRDVLDPKQGPEQRGF